MKGKYKALLDSLPLVAEMIGKTHGIRVFIGKMSQPCRIGKGEIHLPALDPDDEKTLVFARGWLDHEVGHVKHTVPNLKKEAKSEFQASLYNIVEDVRIENLMSQEYPGCRKNLDTSWGMGTLSDEQKAQGYISYTGQALPEWSPRGILECHIVQRERAKVIGQKNPLANTGQTEQVLRQVFGEDFTDGLNVIVDETASLKDSYEAMDLARRIEAYIIDKAGEPPPMPGSGSQESEQSDGDDDNVSGDGSDSDESPSSQKNGSGKRSKKRQQSGQSGQSGNDASDDSGAADASDSGQGQDGNEADGQGQPGSGKRSKKRRNAGQKSGGKGQSQADGEDSGKGTQAPAQTGNKAAQEVLNAGGDIQSPWEIIEAILKKASEEAVENGTAIRDGGGSGASSEYAERVLRGKPIDAKEVYGRTAALRGRMGGLLQAMTMKRRLPSKRGHQMLTRRLARVPLGDNRIFTKHQQVKDTDTLVTLIVDRSGSMDSVMTLAMQAALGVCTGLSEIRGVKTACFAFPGQSENDPVIPLVRFGESVRLKAHKFIPHSAGGTPMANALWHVARSMALEKEPRKIIMVATDGAPDFVDATERIIEKLAKAGIEVMGIGIGVDVSRLFKTSRVIRGIDDLSHAMFAMLTEAMVKFEKREAA